MKGGQAPGRNSGDIYEQAVVKTVAEFFRGNSPPIPRAAETAEGELVIDVGVHVHLRPATIGHRHARAIAHSPPPRGWQCLCSLLAVRLSTFVQQLKRQNAARVKCSLFLDAQEVTRLSTLVLAQNSGTIRATRPLDRGTLCPREALGFMSYDL